MASYARPKISKDAMSLLVISPEKFIPKRRLPNMGYKASISSKQSISFSNSILKKKNTVL